MDERADDAREVQARPALPFVNLRAAADYTHSPVVLAGKNSSRGPWPNVEVWREDQQFLPKESQQASFMASGYQHAILRTSSQMLLHVFQRRQQAAAAAGSW